MKKLKIFKSSLLIIVITLLMIQSSSYLAFAAKADRIAPTAPLNLSAVSVMDDSITIKWDASTDNLFVKNYDIYCNNKYLATTTNTTFTLSSLTQNTSYSLYVKARDANKNVSTSSKTLSLITLINQEKKLIGYYGAWNAYSNNTPDKIKASNLTHLNYAFANISKDGKITLGYPNKDLDNFSKLKELKLSNPNLKTLISVGGWSWSGEFSNVALTEESRTIFADSCIQFIKQYGFDGIDIDWEYPVSGGAPTNSRRLEDKQNYTLLIKKLREKLDEQGLKDNKHYVLSAAVGVTNSYLSKIEHAKISEYLDYVNLMTYDIHGSWDKFTDFNSPLFTSSDIFNQFKWSVDNSVNVWLNSGFTREKIIVGIPFYGFLYSGVNNGNNGLYGTYTSSKTISYKLIQRDYLSQAGYTRFFHKESKVPWLFNGQTFISYDDSESIKLKTDYIISNNLGGAFVWELSQDSNNELLDTIYNGLQ